jgi:hypothetical protein
MTPFHTKVSFAPQWRRITRELTRKRLELKSRSRLITSTAVEPRGPNRRQNLCGSPIAKTLHLSNTMAALLDVYQNHVTAVLLLVGCQTHLRGLM